MTVSSTLMIRSLPQPRSISTLGAVSVVRSGVVEGDEESGFGGGRRRWVSSEQGGGDQSGNQGETPRNAPPVAAV
jgi:hypothetical protein